MINKEYFFSALEVMMMASNIQELRTFVSSLTPDELVYLFYKNDVLWKKEKPSNYRHYKTHPS